MILVDSSAFIEYYRPSGNPAVRAEVAAAVAADRVAVNGIIQTELLAFASRPVDFEALAGDFRAFHWLELRRTEFDLAADLGFGLRQKGVTVPATDLVIAASAIGAGATLYHLDEHFERIAEHGELATRDLRASI
ncbi:MAG: PIN domain-containing protein [Acidobacteriota bacterium]|nr:PIN domain-containing protein [Acidobacteriota bacterium]MDH3523189.1 PIN domain-containing protein [Acidobacteriota bacterium]